MTKQCQKCNQSNPADAAFCLNCASPLNAPAQGSPPWPQQPAAQSASQTSQKPMIALILAIAGFLCCGGFTGIPAAIVGWMELDSIKNGRSPESGKTMATIGLWGGVAATVIHAALWVLWLAMGMISSTAGPYGY